MSAETAADPTPADREKTTRTRRALPITKHVARNGKISYTFQIDAGTKPDGSRDRRRYTYATQAEAKREYARIMTEAAAGTLVRRDKVTLGAFLNEWLDSRRVRPNTLDGYRAALKPVIDHLGTVPLQHVDTPHLDELVTLRLTGEPIPQRAKRGHRSAEVLAYLRVRPEGAAYSELMTTFGEPGIKALDRLVSSGDVLRTRRARYVAALPSEPERPKVPGGVSNRTVCAMLTVLSMALTTAMKRGLVARNVAQLVDRPAIEHREMSTWTPQQVERFREHVRSDRLYACWLLTLAGWRRSEVLGLAWSAVDFDAGTVSVAQGRVVVRGAGTTTGAPKSERSRRTLPMPADVMAALRTLNAQKRERLAFGPTWIRHRAHRGQQGRLSDSARDLLEGISAALHRRGRAGDPVARHQAHRRNADARQRHHGICGGEVAGPRSGDDAAGVRPRVRRRAGVGG
jgi:integrase